MKGGATEPLLAPPPQVKDPNETLGEIFTHKQVFDTFKSSGELLTRNAMVEGNIKPVDVGKKVYQALSYAAYLHKNGEGKLSGKYLLLAIHYMHQMRTGVTHFMRFILKVCLAMSLGLYYIGGKVATKVLKEYFIPIDFAERHADLYFGDLYTKRYGLHDKLCQNGEKISENPQLRTAMETMLNKVRNSHSSLGTGAVLRTGSGYEKI